MNCEFNCPNCTTIELFYNGSGIFGVSKRCDDCDSAFQAHCAEVRKYNEQSLKYQSHRAAQAEFYDDLTANVKWEMNRK